MKNILYTLLFLFIPFNSYAQDEYIIHNGKKENLRIVMNTVIIKYKKGYTDNSLRNIIHQTFTSEIVSENKFKDEAVVINLRNNLTDDKLIMLQQHPGIEYAGFGYKGPGNVIHFPTDEVIVKYKTYLSEFDRNNINKFFNADLTEKIEFFDDICLLNISSKGELLKDNAFDISNKLFITGLVEFAHPNFIRTNMLLYMPNDSLIDSMWHVKNTGTNIPANVQGTPGNDLNLDSAWNITTGNPNVLIAIIDTGCDTGHVDLKPTFCEKSLWYDAYDNDRIPMDEYSHGTPMAGIAAAAGNNLIGTAGVAFGCRIMPVRVFGPWPSAFTTDLILAKGLQWSWQHGASVLSNSWGGGVPTQIVSNAIINAKQFGRNTQGSVVVAGSGNENDDTVYYPASFPGVIGVGGISPCNERKSLVSCDMENWGANYGEGLSVVAPVPFIGTTLVLGGWCICASGTSSATPEVSGIAALLISKNIYISGDSVQMAIEKTAQRVGNYSYSVNKPNGTWNFEMGYGRPDAKKALDFITYGPGFISDLVPPVISMVPPESKVNSVLSFPATIWDNQSVALDNNIPRLYYTKSFEPYSGTINASYNYSQFIFHLPIIVNGEKIYYYIAAQDTSSNPNVTTYPYGGTGSNPPGNISPQKRLFFMNTPVVPYTLNSTHAPIPISTTAETTVVAILNSNLNKTILDLNCQLLLTHEYVEDLTISLISPSGTEIILTSSIGKNGDNYYTTFDDEGDKDIQDTNNLPPFAGYFRPVEKLWFFDGESAFGEWKLVINDNIMVSGGTLESWALNFKVSPLDENIEIPVKFELLGNYPNPFNPVTTIRFNVPNTSFIRIALYNTLGEEVAVILNETRHAGSYQQVIFNALNTNNGRGLSSGVYFYSLFSDNKYIESKKMVLLK